MDGVRNKSVRERTVKPQPKCHGSQLNLSKRVDADQLHFEIGHFDYIMKKKKQIEIEQNRYSTQLVCIASTL